MNAIPPNDIFTSQPFSGKISILFHPLEAAYNFRRTIQQIFLYLKAGTFYHCNYWFAGISKSSFDDEFYAIKIYFQ